jgi:hypothetical protein
MTGADREYFDELIANVGSGICGRGMYDASRDIVESKSL